MWTDGEYIRLRRLIEEIAPNYGCHVALNGGLIHKEDEEWADRDLIIYPIHEVSDVDLGGLFRELERIGVSLVGSPPDLYRFVIKASWDGRPIDFLFPEVPSDNPPEVDETEAVAEDIEF